MNPTGVLELQPEVAAPEINTYGYLTLDIETADASPDAAHRFVQNFFNPANCKKPETIGKRYLDQVEKKKERLALLDESPVICVSLKSDTELRCLHAMGAQDPTDMHGGLIEGFATTTEMLQALAYLLNLYVTPDTVIVGHNILGFDLPKLRWHFVKHRIPVPGCLLDKGQPLFDTMREYVNRFSMQNQPFIALDALLDLIGMDSHKSAISGADVPDLYLQGEVETITGYALLDVLAEAELFLRMTGHSPNDEQPNPVPAPVPVPDPTPETAEATPKPETAAAAATAEADLDF